MCTIVKQISKQNIAILIKKDNTIVSLIYEFQNYKKTVTFLKLPVKSPTKGQYLPKRKHIFL